MADYDHYTIARFWAKVHVGKPTQCWPWAGAHSDAGYGRFRVNGKLTLSHHFAWEIVNGPLPHKDSYHGTVLRHSCDNPTCCNWRHLKPGTQRDNVQDMDIKGRRVEPHSRMDPQTILAIATDPRPHRTIARAYGISATHVGSIKRGTRCASITAAAPCPESAAPRLAPTQPAFL